MMFLVYVISITGLLAYSQLALKWRLASLPPLYFSSFSQIKGSLATLLDPVIVSCYVAIGVAALLYLTILPKFPLNWIYPFMSLNIVFVILGSVFFLKEPITVSKLCGICIIIVGVTIATYQ